MNKYFKQYKWANIKAMLRNNKTPPKICLDSMKGKLVVITGATSGIGYQTVREYATNQADIICINRDELKSKKLCAEVQEEFGVNCEYLLADFANLDDVRSVTRKLMESDRKIEVLIHNAGIHSNQQVFSKDGIELVFQVDFLAAFIMNQMLKEKLKIQGAARILLVNSEGHRFALDGVHPEDLQWEKHGYSGNKSYGAAKTAQILSLFKFTEIFQGSGVTINAVHPGDVKSNIGQNNGKFYRFFKRKFIDPGLKSPEISAKALYYLGVSPEVAGITGKFFNLTTEEEPAPHALDHDVAEELWKVSLKLGGLE